MRRWPELLWLAICDTRGQTSPRTRQGERTATSQAQSQGQARRRTDHHRLEQGPGPAHHRIPRPNQPLPVKRLHRKLDRPQGFPRGRESRHLGTVPRIQNAIDDARAVLDAFHVVKLATAAVAEVRRRVQHNTLGRRGRKGDPLYAIRNILRAGQEHLTRRQRTRLQTALAARDEHVEVEVAYQCSQQLRSAYHQTRLTDGRAIAERIIATFHTCPIPEIARLGRTLKQWRQEFLGYFDTHRSSNGGTEAINSDGSAMMMACTSEVIRVVAVWAS